MPLQRRVPKFGFKNINRKEFKGINLDTIQQLVDAKKVNTITFDVLLDSGLAAKNDRIKILGRGELKSKLILQFMVFQLQLKSAIEAIEAKVVLLL